jgi:hypothetical protein
MYIMFLMPYIDELKASWSNQFTADTAPVHSQNRDAEPPGEEAALR